MFSSLLVDHGGGTVLKILKRSISLSGIQIPIVEYCTGRINTLNAAHNYSMIHAMVK